MNFNEFLSLIKVIRMLYGRDFAEIVFAKNIDQYYDLNSEELTKSQQTVKDY